MSEQLYYTISIIGFGRAAGERFRAMSPGLAQRLLNSESMRALLRYLGYQLPKGASPQTSPKIAPITLALIRTGHDTALIHRNCVEKGPGHLGNFFTHAIINPEIVSTETKAVDTISAYAAISLWQSPFWKTSEEQISATELMLPSLTPEEISQLTTTTSPGTLSIASLQQPYPHCPAERQTVADWLPLVFSAFLMLKKLNKRQLYIAAPAEMVATFIWCITRCLPHTLTIMQELTFSTYEHDIIRTSMTIAGTCWLPPANHSGPFVPQADLPAVCYQPQPFNPVLAINCYTQKQTPFQIDEQVSDFVQFATQSLLQNDLTQLDKFIAQAEQKKHQNIEDVLVPFDIQQKVSRQEVPTTAMVQAILTNSQLWSCLQYTTVLDKFIDLTYATQDTNWQNWWKDRGQEQLKLLRQHSNSEPSSEEATALNIFADRLMSELCQELTVNKQWSYDWAMYWERLLKDISNPSTDLTLWAKLPQRLSPLLYTKTYQHWWEKSGKKIVQDLDQIANKNSQLEEYQLLTIALDYWWQECAKHLKLIWTHRQDAEMSLWLDILSTIRPPTKGAQNWTTLLNDLDRSLPQEKSPDDQCSWENYIKLLAAWQKSQTSHPRRWLTVSWERLPRLLEISDLPSVWKKQALEDRIQLFPPPAYALTQLHVAKCSPLVHEVLAELIQNDKKRELTILFCESLLQERYTERDALLTTILPVLLPYQDLTDRMATAASLSAEQLNEYLEGALYKTLVSQPFIPKWLFSRLESYLANFRAEMINPDHQQVTQAKRNRTRAILKALIKHSQELSKQLYPYVFYWDAISDFFAQPSFDLPKILMIKAKIESVPLTDTQRDNLNQEMLPFLAIHVETELDVQRVIDNFGEVLISAKNHELPPHVLLLKEMAYLQGKSLYNPQKTCEYIRIVLSETLNLAYLNIEQTKQEQFADECLRSLLTSVDPSQVRSIQTTQWPPAIANLWNAYLLRVTTTRPIGMIKPTVPLSSTGQYSSVPTKQTGQQPIMLPDPSRTKQLPRQTKPEASPPNNADLQPVTLNRRDNPPQPLQKRISRSDNENNNIKTLIALKDAINSKRADKIAKAYDEKLDRWLTAEERQLASIARKLVQSHEKAKTTGDYAEFIDTYSTHYKEFILSKDINATVKQHWKEIEKRKEE